MPSIFRVGLPPPSAATAYAARNVMRSLPPALSASTSTSSPLSRIAVMRQLGRSDTVGQAAASARSTSSTKICDTRCGSSAALQEPDRSEEHTSELQSLAYL